MKINHKIGMIAIVLFICGCNNMAPEELDEHPVNTDCTPQFPGMNVTYDNYVKGVLTRNCTSCHYGGNSPGPGNFTTYGGVMVHVDHFPLRVTGQHADMPQGKAPLPQSTRDSLNIWIGNCSPEN